MSSKFGPKVPQRKRKAIILTDEDRRLAEEICAYWRKILNQRARLLRRSNEKAVRESLDALDVALADFRRKARTPTLLNEWLGRQHPQRVVFAGRRIYGHLLTVRQRGDEVEGIASLFNRSRYGFLLGYGEGKALDPRGHLFAIVSRQILELLADED